MTNDVSSSDNRVEPNTFFCPEHQVNHKRGSAIYYRCLEQYFDSESETEAPVDVEVVEVEEPEDPIKITRTALSVSYRLNEGELFCVLTDEAPDQVTVASAIYEKGIRIFNRRSEPFIVTEMEFEKVLNRGARYFEAFRPQEKGTEVR